MASEHLTTSPKTLSRLRLAVAGGGVLGLSIAALAARAGARVTVFEPRARGDNASGVAAGMLAPALEAALDGEAADYPLFQHAYAAWPAFAAAFSLPPPPDLQAGALLLAPHDALERAAARLAELGAPAERLTRAQASALQPALALNATEALHVREDGRIDPPGLLTALAAQLRAAGGDVMATECPPPPVEGFDATVLAAGYETRRWIDVAPALAALQPVKGHVLHFQGGPTGGPTVRGAAGYAAPQRGGVVFGATMEPGRADLALDATAVAALHAAAVEMLPALASVRFTARTGVRAATPDGRPLVGPAADRLWLATGARRNGWLLAPLIAQAVVEGLHGKPVRGEFRVGRFGAAEAPPLNLELF